MFLHRYYEEVIFLRNNEDAQIHILEMLTLFWLFFMSATFLIRIDVRILVLSTRRKFRDCG